MIATQDVYQGARRDEGGHGEGGSLLAQPSFAVSQRTNWKAYTTGGVAAETAGFTQEHAVWEPVTGIWGDRCRKVSRGAGRRRTDGRLESGPQPALRDARRSRASCTS